ncbi:MAG: hypothetical protein DMD69_02530 [Gemmatimonadetes bacterium]|nr:MAG: hypothetical protein DMD69_02530 [Gemmatimonadota bacterium]PYP27415.1 MAG: hypothetical protein DMD55_08430 [Gemmatimonadota bacterium]
MESAFAWRIKPEEPVKPTSKLFTSAMLACGLALITYAAAAAQKPAHATAPRGSHQAASQPTVGQPKPKNADDFRGIASKLNTTSDALESAYQTARQANPKLTHGQFVAATMLANNLGSKNPSITTQAILDGLQSGKSIGQTLQSLGLSAKDAKEAERAAARDAREARKQAQAQQPASKSTNP